MLFNNNQKSSTDQIYISKKFPSATIKYFDHTSPVAINVYENKTIIIIFSKKITSLCITSKDVANSFREYFDLLWKTAKK